MNIRSTECWGTDLQARALRIELSTQRSLVLPLDQFVYSELCVEAAEHVLKLVFSTHEVTVHGTGFRRLEGAIHRMELSHICELPASRHASVSDGQPCVRKISLKEIGEIKDNPG